MHPYLVNTRPAAEVIIDAVFQEERELVALRLQLTAAEPNALERGAADFVRFTDAGDDDEGIGQLRIAEAWDARVQINRLSQTVERLARSIADKEQAAVALCGALRQIAKTGITGKAGPAKGKLTVSGPGRVIDGLTLSDLVWGARNQSMHLESAPTNPLTKRVFDTLFTAHSSRFDAALGNDLAREVIDLLGWTELSNYEADMATILP